MVTSNQLGKITNAQFEELQTQITQVILKNKIQEILQKGELHENWENFWKDTSTIDTIESLSIIQRTQPKPSDYYQLQLALSTKLRQNLILENPEIETLNLQTPQNQNNPNPNINNQQNLPPIIVINPSLQSNLDPIVYAPITKLEKFTGKEDDVQVWLNNIEKTILEFLQYFSNNNSINCLTSIFTTIKQRETEAVTTYLGHFYRNLCQIQAIQADYFTVPQILNQFICSLHSSILQCVHPLYSADLQATVTNARDFEAAKLEANYVQAVNLVINESSELDSKLKQFSNSINQKLEGYLQETCSCYNCGKQDHIKASCQISNSKPLLKSRSLSITLHSNSTATNLPNPSLSNSSTSYLPATVTTMVVHQLILSSFNHAIESHPRNLKNEYNQNQSSQNYLSLLVTPKDVSTNNNLKISLKQMINNNILLATVTNNKSLAAIFFFKIKKPTKTPLFSGAILNMKLITAIYTNVKIDEQAIKLILNSGSTGSIIT
ncbi:hypothetical protein G9A89_022250 [Geosiphon pyriformis]|nr:hypothetical protein G9A89_022250 [Geosiphon pyriformis]